MSIQHVLAVSCLSVCLASAQPAVSLELVASGLNGPLDIQNAGDGSGRLFLAEQRGVIRVLEDGALDPVPFLDIRTKVSAGGERGLLGLAFPPDFGRKQHFYVNYTRAADGATVVARYRVSGNPGVADPASETVILLLNQPFSNHNGGGLVFGPDGFLYIGTGDGGSAFDPLNNAQNRQSLLGKMLRIDVEGGAVPYGVPPDNPFVHDPTYRPEIWALGLRNPWRYSFDRASGDLWIADVGQGRVEEINLQPSGGGGENYGWRRMEGTLCVEEGCDTAGLTLPVHEYTHSAGECAVTGGFVYRGERSPALRGTYIYSDYCSGRIWALRREGGEWVNRLLLSSGRSVSSFGEDEAGEIYLAAINSGEILRIDGPPNPAVAAGAVVNGASFAPGIVAGSVATAFVSGILSEDGSVAADSIPLPEILDGVRILVDGVPAPLYAIARANNLEQVSFQAPFELQGHNSALVTVERDGMASSPVHVPVFGVQPGVFSLDGVEALVVRHPDGTLVSPENPLVRGGYAILYVSGLGPVSHQPGTGAAAGFSPLAESALPEVTLGLSACEVTFSGLAPGFVGVYQVNIRVPAEAPEGAAELVVTLNGSPSPPLTTYVEPR
jgi:uncharacterized protein (TIGR03437 family)